MHWSNLSSRVSRATHRTALHFGRCCFSQVSTRNGLSRPGTGAWPSHCGLNDLVAFDIRVGFVAWPAQLCAQVPSNSFRLVGSRISKLSDPGFSRKDQSLLRLHRGPRQSHLEVHGVVIGFDDLREWASETSAAIVSLKRPLPPPLQD